MTSPLDRLYALDPLLGAQMRTIIERLRQRIEDLESQSCVYHEEMIDNLITLLASTRESGNKLCDQGGPKSNGSQAGPTLR